MKNMTEDYAIRRREYVNEIRRSFDEPQKIKEEQQEKEVSSSFLMVKLRIIVALCLFLAFLLCHVTKYEFYGYQTKELIDIISDNHYYTNLQDYVKINMYE